MPTAKNDALLVKVSEGARLLNISQRTYWDLLHERKLPCVRIGRAVRTPLAAIHEFIEANSIPAA